jgi:hypothetical protein
MVGDPTAKLERGNTNKQGKIMLYRLDEQADTLLPAQPETQIQTTSLLDKIQLLTIEYITGKGLGLDYATEKSKEIVNGIVNLFHN